MSRINRVLVLFGVLLVMSGSAMAFENFPLQVRLHSLGGGAESGFTTNYWNDSNHAVGMHDWNNGMSFGWYGELANYTDMATISFESEGEGQAFWFNKNEETFGNYFVGLQKGNGDYLGRQGGEYNHLTLGYGYPMEGMNLGVIFNRQNISTTMGDEEVNDTWHMFGVGIDYELNDETNVDAAFSFTTGNYEDTAADVDEDGSGFGFGARAFYDWRENLTLVPVLMFNSAEYMDGFKQTFMGFGLGFAYSVNEDNHMVFGLDYQNMKEEWDPPTTARQDAYEETTTTLPGFYLAVEHEFTDWLTIRSGATKNWMKSDNGESGDDLVESSTYPWGFSFGAGIAMGDWQIDLGLNQTWLYDIGYWFHGSDAGQSPIFAIQGKLFF